MPTQNVAQLYEFPNGEKALVQLPCNRELKLKYILGNNTTQLVCSEFNVYLSIMEKVRNKNKNPYVAVHGLTDGYNNLYVRWPKLNLIWPLFECVQDSKEIRKNETLYEYYMERINGYGEPDFTTYPYPFLDGAKAVKEYMASYGLKRAA